MSALIILDFYILFLSVSVEVTRPGDNATLFTLITVTEGHVLIFGAHGSLVINQ